MLMVARLAPTRPQNRIAPKPRRPTGRSAPSLSVAGLMADITDSDMARGQPPDGFVPLGLAVTVVIAGRARQLVDYALDLHIAALDPSGDGGVLGVALTGNSNRICPSCSYAQATEASPAVSGSSDARSFQNCATSLGSACHPPACLAR
jgi:hypothetical protein